MGRCVKQRI